MTMHIPNEENGRLEQLIQLAAKPPAKNVKELSAMVQAMAFVLIDMHLEVKRNAGTKETLTRELLTRVLAPILVGVLLWLLLDLAPALFNHLPPI